MPVIQLEPACHRGAWQIALRFEKDPGLNGLLKTLPFVRWSKTLGCWYMEMQKENYELLRLHLQGKADFDTRELKAYLDGRKTDTRIAPSADSSTGT